MTIQILKACNYSHRGDDGFVRLTAEDTFFCKRFVNMKEYKASARKKFKLGSFHDPDNLESLLPILQDLEKDNKSLVIRHKYNVETEKVLRRAEEVSPHPSNIIAMDVDELPRPNHLSPTDLVGQADYVCSILNKCDPETFPCDLGYIVQASSKAGLTEYIKIHLWIKNEDKVTQGQLRNVFTQVNTEFKSLYNCNYNLVDTALYHDAQAHYTSAPMFKPNTDDPFLLYPRTLFQFGRPSYVPDNVASFSKTVKATEDEIEEYLSKIEGGDNASKRFIEKFNTVKDWKVLDRGLRVKVISLYHEALQDTYNIELLDRLVLPILEDKRPGEAEDYIRQAKIAAVNEVKNNSTRTVPLSYENLGIENIPSGELPKYLNISRVPEEGVVFLKASLGTGKTHTIENWLKTGKIKGKFLSLTDTSALVESNASRFDAGDFRSSKDRLDFATGQISRLSGTLHSLHKIKDFTNDFDFLFIDEADSMLNNLLFAKIIDDETRFIIREVLYELLMNTKLVVLSDGDISEETTAQYIELIEGDREFFRVNHQRANLKGVKVFKHSTESSIWGAVQGSLELNQKCIVLTDEGPDKLNLMKNTLDRALPDKVIKVAHANSRADKDVQEIITETNNALSRQKVNALLCSPSVTNGVDFNYFDVAFVVTKTSNHTPNMRFQALMRERDPKSIHYYFANIKGYVTGYKTSKVDSGWFDKARHAYALRKEKEFRSYVCTFNYYLIKAGCTIQALTEPFESPVEAADKATYALERAQALVDAKPDVLIPRHNDAFELQELCMYYYDLDYVDLDSAIRFIEERPDESAEFLHMLFKDFWYVLKEASEFALMKALKEKGKEYYLATGREARPTVKNSKYILSKCGIGEEIDPVIENYKKFCVYNSIEIPEILKDNEEEDMYEIV